MSLLFVLLVIICCLFQSKSDIFGDKGSNEEIESDLDSNEAQQQSKVR